jgi:hypothetical protein
MVMAVLNATFRLASLNNFVILRYVVIGVGECNPFSLFSVFSSFITLLMFQPIIQNQNVVLLVSVV